MTEKLNEGGKEFDFIVIGGGASGAGIILEAASRGYSAVLLEKYDFAKSTSGKSTKLVHGGVRYLAQGNIGLVREACIERGFLFNNAPHLVKNQSFVIPVYTRFEEILYTIGLKMYDLLAGKFSIGRSERISSIETLSRLKTIKGRKLKAGVLYHDGQFDDSRLAINVLQTAVELGAVVLNYMPVTGLLKNNSGRISGIRIKDFFTGNEAEVMGKVVINATGVFADDILQMDTPGIKQVITPSQGVHVVLDKSFLPGEDALMIPQTDDGRVLFIIPWHGKVIAGTTDTPVKIASAEPVPLEEEIRFILETAGRFLTKPPLLKDIRSVWAGLRPLASYGDTHKKTKEISRSHKIMVSPSGMLTMIGGKWTTYRRMAEDIINKAEAIKKLRKTRSVTRDLKIHGHKETVDYRDPLYFYGADRTALIELIKYRPELEEYLSEDLGIIKAQVVWAVKNEMAVTVEDFLSRRTRCLLLDTRESLRIAKDTAAIMANEMDKDNKWIESQVKEFELLARNYLPGDRSGFNI